MSVRIFQHVFGKNIPQNHFLKPTQPPSHCTEILYWGQKNAAMIHLMLSIWPPSCGWGFYDFFHTVRTNYFPRSLNQGLIYERPNFSAFFRKKKSPKSFSQTAPTTKSSHRNPLLGTKKCGGDPPNALYLATQLRLGPLRSFSYSSRQLLFSQLEPGLDL